MADQEIPVTLVLTNPKCLRALAECTELVDELEEDFPWKDEVKKLKRRLWYLCHHLELRVESGE